MAVILSWSFLILSPISFVIILSVSILKADKKMQGVLFGSLLGGFSALIFFLISAYIGMNFY